ncbi:MAG: hypothetical protein AB1801_12315 [Chloroflexota bacterium]
MTDTDAANRYLQQWVGQLYEDEGLTRALTDEAAAVLLQWGEQQLTNLAHISLSQAELDRAAGALHQALRLSNRLIEQRTELSETDLIQLLLKLIDQVIFLTITIQQGSNND